MTEAVVLPQNVTDFTAVPSPAPTEGGAIAAAPKAGAPLQNTNAFRTGRRSKRDLALANLPNDNAERNRDAWWNAARVALVALKGREPTFAEVEALHAAARHEAVIQLAEARRRTKGLSFDQQQALADTITEALAAKGKLLAKLGLVPSDKAATSDYARFYGTDADDAEPEAAGEPPGSPQSDSAPAAPGTTTKGENAAPCPAEKLPQPLPADATLRESIQGDAA